MTYSDSLIGSDGVYALKFGLFYGKQQESVYLYISSIQSLLFSTVVEYSTIIRATLEYILGTITCILIMPTESQNIINGLMSN